MARLVGGHGVELLQGARELFPALVAAMDAATIEIQFETYICDFTDSGASIAEALMRAARRGVRAQLLVDGFGTGRLAREWIERMRSAGVHYQVYSPLGPLGMLLPHRWRRLHRKLCVVDDQVLFCGGINVLDDFYDPNHGTLEAPRLDFAVRATGALVLQASDTMEKVWWRMQAATDIRHRRLRDAAYALRAVRRQSFVPPRSGTGMDAALLLRDNVRHRSDIEKAYLRAIALAREEIIIANAYFVPGRRLRRALVLAAGRGVRVRLLLQGRYEYFLQYHAARPVYGELLAAGIEIHEYSPSFLHAKVAVIDAMGARPWATVGSSNLDPLSLLLAREANVVVENREFARDLRERLADAMANAGWQMDPQRYAGRPWRERVLDRVAFALVRAALWVTGNRY